MRVKLVFKSEIENSRHRSSYLEKKDLLKKLYVTSDIFTNEICSRKVRNGKVKSFKGKSSKYSQNSTR